MKESEMFELIDKWFEKNIEKNEVITTGYGCTVGRNNVGIRYSRITNNNLIQQEWEIDKIFLCRLSEYTVLTIIADILKQLREAEE